MFGLMEPISRADILQTSKHYQSIEDRSGHMRTSEDMDDTEIGSAPYSNGKIRRRVRAVFSRIQEKHRLRAALAAVQASIDTATAALSATERRELDDMLKVKCSVVGCAKQARIKGRCHQHYIRDWLNSQGPCSVAGCRKQAHSGKMCQQHYNLLLRPKIPCSIDDCEAPVYAKGMCQRHYRRAHT